MREDATVTERGGQRMDLDAHCTLNLARIVKGEALESLPTIPGEPSAKPVEDSDFWAEAEIVRGAKNLMKAPRMTCGHPANKQDMNSEPYCSLCQCWDLESEAYAELEAAIQQDRDDELSQAWQNGYEQGFDAGYDEGYQKASTEE